jgi:hypothetical protein
MATRDEKFRQAAWTYAVYGVVYWLGGLALAAAGLGPRGMERGRWAWFVVGALFVLIIPWVLTRPWRWRRAFAAVLALLVGYRAFEVARLAAAPRTETVPVLGVDIPFRLGAWAFCLLTLATAVMLVRASWSRDA